LSILALAYVFWGSASLHAADLSGVWQGGIFGGPIVWVLHQDGATLSGTAGTSGKEQQVKLEKIKLEGDRLTASAGSLQFDLRVQGETLAGDVTRGPASPPDVFHLVLRRRNEAARKAMEGMKFEVASVKPVPASQNGTALRPSRTEFVMNAVTLQTCIAYAYGLGFNDDSAIAGPAWLKTAHYSIVAKLPPDSDFEQNQAMLRNLLAERFKLVVHRETKEVSGYALVPAKGGFKLKEVAFRATPGPGMGPGQIKLASSPVSRLAQVLSVMLDQPVENDTGIEGFFDIELTWTIDESSAVTGGSTGWSPMGSARDDAPAVMAAMQRQLGLKLEPRKLQKEMVMVDHAEKVPVEN
jgi:uncharacterized protein (TIGR03435 family)